MLENYQLLKIKYELQTNYAELRSLVNLKPIVEPDIELYKIWQKRYDKVCQSVISQTELLKLHGYEFRIEDMVCKIW